MKTLLCKSKSASSVVAVLAGLSLAVGVAACGGGSKNTKVAVKSGLGEGNKVQPPPSIGSSTKQAPARKLTADAKKDFKAAVAFYNEKAKEGWNKGNCQAAAERFDGVAADHPKLVEARYDAGLSYHQCGMKKDAEREYQMALQIHSSHAPSISNLGEIYFKSGKVEAAKKYWERAIEADPKLIAARNNLAWLLIEEMRSTSNRSAWSRLEKEAAQHLSSVLAVDNENVKAYVLYGLLYMEGSERNENRLDLAKLLLDEASKRNANYASLHNAFGLYYMRRDALGLALEEFQKAVALDPNFIEARRNVGSITLGFRKYDVAAEQFAKVIELSPKCYDSHIGLGIANRGLGNLDKAEEYYEKAKKIGPGRGAAYFNLGVLYKDFLANKATDLRGNQAAYRKAKGYFEQFLTKADASAADKKEAKNNIKDCDKIIDQLEKVIQQQAKDAAGGAGG